MDRPAEDERLRSTRVHRRRCNAARHCQADHASRNSAECCAWFPCRGPSARGRSAGSGQGRRAERRHAWAPRDAGSWARGRSPSCGSLPPFPADVAFVCTRNQRQPFISRLTAAARANGGICAVCASCGLEKIELICRRLARYGPLPGSLREDPMLRPNPPIAMGCGNWPSGPAAVSPRRQAFWDRYVGQGNAPRGADRDQTSRPELPATDRRRGGRDCSGKPPGRRSRSPHEREHNARPKDATDKETCVPRSCGCSFLVLFNTVRPHSSLAI